MIALEARKQRRRVSVPARAVAINAKYDAAQTSDNDTRHWAWADSLSADRANSPSVRKILRNRARYEVANNSYARGIVNTLANDVIGTGPRLQVQTGDTARDRIIESAFTRWSEAIGLCEKLRTMRIAQVQDGESFGILRDNPRVDDLVKLDIQTVEAEQVSSMGRDLMLTDGKVDGIEFDDFGNPTVYYVLKQHPGETYNATMQGDPYEAQRVIHLFKAERPGQHRGVPEILAALPLFAQLRRYTLAVIAAAETAANFAGVIESMAAPQDPDDTDEAEPFETVEIERNALTTMPFGWKLSQLRAEQPTTTYADFKREIINEIARCLSMPFNVAAGNSSGYNYASGRLDHQTYYKAIRINQRLAERIALSRVLDAWFIEARTLEGDLSRALSGIDIKQVSRWFWDGNEHVDPQKEATAQQTRLANHTTTLAREYARQGLDWEAELQQRAKELKLQKDLGLLVDLQPDSVSSKTESTQSTGGDDADEDE